MLISAITINVNNSRAPPAQQGLVHSIQLLGVVVFVFAYIHMSLIAGHFGKVLLAYYFGTNSKLVQLGLVFTCALSENKKNLCKVALPRSCALHTYT